MDSHPHSSAVKRILVALSGTPYTPTAVRYAMDLAQAHGAQVTGVTVTDLGRLANVGSVPMGAAAVASELAEHRIQVTEERVHEAVADFERACNRVNVAHRVEHETCDPLDELTSLWRYHDLTIFGLRGLFEYGVVHNPDDMLLRIISHGLRPLVAVAADYRPVRRVLVAYNGSIASAKAMKQFVQFNLWPDPETRIACFDRKPEEGKTLLDEAAGYCRAHGLDPETELVDAAPRHALLDYAADWNADLIVLGSSSRHRIIKRVLGDTVLTAIRESPVPLFLSR